MKPVASLQCICFKGRLGFVWWHLEYLIGYFGRAGLVASKRLDSQRSKRYTRSSDLNTRGSQALQATALLQSFFVVSPRPCFCYRFWTTNLVSNERGNHRMGPTRFPALRHGCCSRINAVASTLIRHPLSRCLSAPPNPTAAMPQLAKCSVVPQSGLL